jgi:hypothetical protein
VDDDPLVPAPGRGERGADRVRALGPAGDDADVVRSLVEPRRAGDDDLVDGRRRAQDLEGPRVERTTCGDDERLGPVGPEALAAAGGDEEGGSH